MNPIAFERIADQPVIGWRLTITWWPRHDLVISRGKRR